MRHRRVDGVQLELAVGYLEEPFASVGAGEHVAEHRGIFGVLGAQVAARAVDGGEQRACFQLEAHFGRICSRAACLSQDEHAGREHDLAR